MRKPPAKPASGKAKEPAGSGFPGGRAAERVRQFERARGLGPPARANAPEMPASDPPKRQSKTPRK